MQVYLVGGAVRDALLGLSVQDRDWVVVGAQPQSLQAAGFEPVGRDFPVFLHPRTHEQFALARTERKNAPGYHGFAFHAAPDVTLEQDLARRDLTINSIAVYAGQTSIAGLLTTDLAINPGHWEAHGLLVDPYGGVRDLRARVLRHTSPAFAEDPVRVLRLARLAARFSDFRVDPGTMDLLRQMSTGGELDHLVGERVWQELSKGLMQQHPSRMLRVLHDCGALAHVLPGVHCDAVLERTLDLCALRGAELSVRAACLGAHATLRMPSDCQALAELLMREEAAIAQCASLDAARTVALLQRCDAFRKPERFAQLLLACTCRALGAHDVPTHPDTPYAAAARLRVAHQASLAVDIKSIAAHALSTGFAGFLIGKEIEQARVAAVQRYLPPGGQ